MGPYLNWHFKTWHVPYIPPLSPIYHRVELNFYLKKIHFKVEYFTIFDYISIFLYHYISLFTLYLNRSPLNIGRPKSRKKNWEKFEDVTLAKTKNLNIFKTKKGTDTIF